MRRTLTNIASIVGGEVAIRIANFAAAVLIARMYGPVALGLYATALAFATIVGSLADNGLSVSAVAEVKRRRHEIDRVVTSLYFTKTILFLIACVGVALIVLWWHPTKEQWLIGILLLAKVLFNSYGALNFGVLKSLDKMHAIGTLQLAHASVLLCCIGAVYYKRYDISTLLLALLVAQAAELLSSGTLLWRAGVRYTPVRSFDCMRLVVLSTPIGLSCLLSSIILRIDVLAISALGIVSQVGHFASADNGLIVVYLAASLFGSVLLPEMIGLTPTHLATYISRWTRLILATSVPIVAGAAAIAKWLIVLLYGKSFEQAGAPASIMILAAPLIILNAMHFNRAIALQLHRTYVSISAGTAVLAVVLSFGAAQIFGTTGVAVAILIREALMFTMYVLFARTPYSPGTRDIAATLVAAEE
jgi:O-antigen/teichoic acid export membrane protein